MDHWGHLILLFLIFCAFITFATAKVHCKSSEDGHETIDKRGCFAKANKLCGGVEGEFCGKKDRRCLIKYSHSKRRCCIQSYCKVTYLGNIW
jgi:hypothetical protein